MSARLKDINRKLLLGELQALLQELRNLRTEIRESGDSSRSAELAKRVELARGKLDDLRCNQRREKEIHDRKRRIEQDNAKRG